MMIEKTIDGFLFSTDKAKLDIPYLYKFISQESYWAVGVPEDVVRRAIDNSWCFGVYDDGKQMAFARLITDHATFAYLADVFVDVAYRGRGISKHLTDFIFGMEEVKSLRRIVLVTRDAHSLYARHDFKPLAKPENYMELHRPDIYKRK